MSALFESQDGDINTKPHFSSRDIKPQSGQNQIEIMSKQSGPTSSPTTTEAPTKAHEDNNGKKWFEEMRGWIMVVAVLVASVTYTSGLNPPGGFWQDDLNNHTAGTSILHDKSPERYTTFFYANATAFMASLIIIILLMNENFYSAKPKVAMLYISMVLDLVSLMIAYAAGCTIRITTSIYVIVLAVVVLLLVVHFARFLPVICKLIKKCAPGIHNAVAHNLIIESA